MNVTCSAEPCPIILNATCVFYEGTTLLYTGITTNDNLQIALQKIDAKFADAAIGYAFNNGLIQSAPGQPVQLGGSLIQNTSIGGNYRLAFVGQLESSAFITTGGASTDSSGSAATVGGLGGSGIVIVRYLKSVVGL